ncbi:hypothetical protein GRS66_007251 [Saccharomyces pastorianus]|uniref:Uncharacterized protein n=1 Tax=Saccharomyces pastorianus TaxID=27292 RepID=A0A6C1E7M2_SACPS|nr:hypothetical protein GRS66_007251 [Saccharomyces pastorianus]
MELGCEVRLFWGLCLAVLIWAVFDLPETAGRTFIEINELFRLGVPARKFKSTKWTHLPPPKQSLMTSPKDPKEDMEAFAEERAKHPISHDLMTLSEMVNMAFFCLY